MSISIGDYKDKIKSYTEDEYLKCFEEINKIYIDLINELNDDYSEILLNYFRSNIFSMEKFLPRKFIIDFKSNFKRLDKDELQKDYVKESIKKLTNEDDIMNEAINIVRNIIFKKMLIEKPYDEKEFDDINMQNKCLKTSTYVNYIFNLLGLKSKIIKLDPAFSPSINLYGGSGYHFFNEVTIEDKNYIVDCSYSQFFTMFYNNLLKLNLGIDGCLPGIFMLQDKKRLKMAKSLLTNGYIEANEQNIKNYFDGFAISYRNAAYYENLGYIDYNTNYTASDYDKMIHTLDDQSNHEDIKYLGFIEDKLQGYTTDFIKDTRFFENESDNEQAKQIIKKLIY